MNIKNRRVNRVTVLELSGSISRADAQAFMWALRQSLSPIVLNFAKVHDMDANGVGLILQGYLWVVQNGGWVAVTELHAIDPFARKLLSRMLKSYSTEAEAVAAMAKVAS